jgi:drug/metabolite transporter (DMT)-like permease
MKARTHALTATAMVCFAANSLLCRAALGRSLVDAASYTSVRLLSGAIVLSLLARLAGHTWPGRRDLRPAAALFVYAIAFSLAYVRIPAALGALLLFGAVQVTMIGRAVAVGERPAPAEWAGMLLSVAGLVSLAFPGLHRGDLAGTLLMLVAGIFWGIYSLLGRSNRSGPLVANAVGFTLAVPLALLASAASASLSAPRLTPAGVGLAVASGALATAGGCALWFTAMKSLSATQAGIVQLAVPPLAAFGGVLLLGEPVTFRLALSAAAILGGIALAVTARRA